MQTAKKILVKFNIFWNYFFLYIQYSSGVSASGKIRTILPRMRRNPGSHTIIARTHMDEFSVSPGSSIRSDYFHFIYEHFHSILFWGISQTFFTTPNIFLYRDWNYYQSMDYKKYSDWGRDKNHLKSIVMWSKYPDIRSKPGIKMPI